MPSVGLPRDAGGWRRPCLLAAAIFLHRQFGTFMGMPYFSFVMVYNWGRLESLVAFLVPNEAGAGVAVVRAD
jgi:hypothetical protein